MMAGPRAPGNHAFVVIVFSAVVLIDKYSPGADALMDARIVVMGLLPILTSVKNITRWLDHP